MKIYANVSPQNSHYHSTFEFKDNGFVKMSEREFRNLLLKMISDLKEDSNKQIRNLGNKSKT
jgi:hypothetical protein